MNRETTLPHGFKGVWLLFAAVGVIGAVVLRMLLIEHEGWIRGLSPGCFFRRITGFHCAGCGGTRAFFAFLKGDLALSWRMNPLFPAGLAIAGLFGLKFCWNAVRPGESDRFAWIGITARAGWFLLAVALGFAILRNLPWWPFTLLAPPG